MANTSRVLQSAFAAVLLVAASQVAVAQTVGSLTLADTWSRATPGGAKVGAGYLTITNMGKTSDRLTGVSSSVSGRGEVHEMATKDGIMTMRELTSGLEIPAGQSVTLRPGGLHLMFQDLKQPLKSGEPFEATLTFERAGPVKATFDVRAIAAGAPSGGAGMGGMGGMKMDH